MKILSTSTWLLAVALAIVASASVRAADCQYSIGVACPPNLDPQSFVNGLSVQLNGGIGADSELCEPAAHIYWDWGDGNTQEALFPAIHEYASMGDYEITVWATDAEDLELANTSCSLSVWEVPNGSESISLGTGAWPTGGFSAAIGHFAGSHGFSSLADAKDKIAAWLKDYNESRPHRALNNLAPLEYVAQLENGA
jgi:hypothetical protein